MPIYRLLLLAFLAAPVLAQEAPEPDQAQIDDVNRLGRLLLAYDQAAWHGSDAVASLLQADQPVLAERVRGYVAEPSGDGWRVSFGRLSPDSSALLVYYEARLDSAYRVVGTAAYPQPLARDGFPRDASLALDLAVARFTPPEQVRYNTAVLPAPGGLVYVYVLPAQPDVNVYYVGADFRYMVDPAARTVTDERRLHNALLTHDLREQPYATTLSSAILTDIPTETDVFYAMSRPEGITLQATHYVVTDDWVFFLDGTGVGAWMTREAWQRLTSNR